MQPITPQDPAAILRVSRILWGALCGGVWIFALVVAIVIRRSPMSTEPIPREQLMLLFYVAMGMCFATIPLGLFIRGQVFKAGWVGDVVKPANYLQGCLVAWAMCEGTAVFSLVICLLSRTFVPYAIPAVIASVVLLALWPNGRALWPPDKG